MFIAFGNFRPNNLPPMESMELKLKSVNKFINNISLVAPNRLSALCYRESPAEFVIWYAERFNAVNIQVKSDFVEKNQNRKLGIQADEKKITYYVNGAPVSEIKQSQKELFKRLFSHAKQWAARKMGESSEGLRESGSLEVIRSEEQARYNEILKAFFPPKEEMILHCYREVYSHLNINELTDLQMKTKQIAYAHFFKIDKLNMEKDFINSKEMQLSIYKASLDLFGSFKENLIFPIGQSPAWFAAIAQINEPNPQRFCHVAFSGRWYELFDNPEKLILEAYENQPIKDCDCNNIKYYDKNLKLQIVDDNIPNFEQISCYRSYLSRIGCSPQRILGQKEPSVIVDYIRQAGGIKSFLEFLFVWAADEGINAKKLKSKLIIQCMHDKKSPIFLAHEDGLREYLQLNLGEYSSHPIILSPIEESNFPMDDDGVLEMISIKDDAINEKSRLVKYFPPIQWTEENCKKSSFGNDKVNEYIFPIYVKLMNTLEKIEVFKK